MSEAGTLARLFLKQAAARGDAPGLKSKQGGVWTPVSWREWERRARALAARLVEVGVARGDRVAIFGQTREEWLVTDLAGLMAGATTVPIYPSLVADQAAYILRDSGARVLVAEDATYVERIAAVDRPLVEGMAKTWLFAELPLEDAPKALASQVDDRIAAGHAHDLATLVYTSGTTGPPKGVMLTHANLVAEVRALDGLLPIVPDDEQLLFLPMAHIFGRVLVAMAYEVGYTTTIAESMLKALDNAAEVNPTFMGCVPRLYEKVYAVANEKAAQAGGLKAALFRWATRVGSQGGGGAARWAADKLVLSKIRARFGTRLRFAISGGAPLAKELAQWFEGAGLVILEAYGLTETTGGSTINTLQKRRFGTVGPPLPGVEVSLAKDGEVLIRGATVMRGYWNKESDTREAIDDAGWFHSGDIGELDADVRAEVEREIAAVNARLSSFESVKRFAILDRDFTIEGGELTPTLKVKRKVVSERHEALLDSLYE